MGGVMADTDINKATILRLVEAHNRQDAADAAACFEPRGTNHGRVAGPMGMEQVYRSLYSTFPDYHWDIQLLLAEGDWVALHVMQSGTHLGTPELPVLGGLIHRTPPTRKAVSVANIHFYEMKDGLIIKHQAVRDDLGMMQQMGLLPASADDISRPQG
jgi:predicted ester cyclase